jgi:hypothetical protein
MQRSVSWFKFQMALLITLPMMLAAYSGASSQTANAGPDNPSSASSSGDVSQQVDDGMMQRTAAAYVKVQQIEQSGQQALAGARDNAQKQQIAEQIEAKKLNAVKAEGLQPQQYNQVVRLALADKAFEQKFLSYVRNADS